MTLRLAESVWHNPQSRGLDVEHFEHRPGPLDHHTLIELRAIAKAAGLDGFWRMSRAQLIARLDAHAVHGTPDDPERLDAPPPGAPAEARADRPYRPSF